MEPCRQQLVTGRQRTPMPHDLGHLIFSTKRDRISCRYPIPPKTIAGALGKYSVSVCPGQSAQPVLRISCPTMPPIFRPGTLSMPEYPDAKRPLREQVESMKYRLVGLHHALCAVVFYIECFNWEVAKKAGDVILKIKGLSFLLTGRILI